MKKLPLTFGLVLLLSLLLSGIASAHVTVQPTETTQGSYEKFTVRVPSEKAVPTVKVEVKFPLDQVTISRFEPKTGWKYELSKDGDKITGVIWTATGEGLGPTEFGEFYMRGKSPTPQQKLRGRRIRHIRTEAWSNGSARQVRTSRLP